MSAKTQHEFHPDGEMLSAFAEQALSKHDRGEVFAHLAECGRCRQIVSLASEAAGTESAPHHLAPVRPRLWWRSWGLALAPVAALAATAVIAVYVHERDVERNAEVAKVEQQQADRNATPPQPSTQPQAENVPPAPVAPASAPPKARETERPSAEKHAQVAEPDENASAPPPPEGADAPFSARDELAPPSAKIHRSIARVPAPPDASFAPSPPSANQGTPPEIAIYDEDGRMQAEEKATEERRFAAKAATPASESRSESRAPGSSEQVVVTDQQLETQAAPPANVGSLMGFRAGGFSASRVANRVHLPSGLPAISIAHEGPRMLAIDNAGTLFLSEDSGTNWELVAIQWTGRVVLVRKRAVPGSAAAAPPADKSNVAGGATGPEAASESDTVFELLNDQGQLWWSTDGRIWTAK
jgi:Putative zinc-finger